MTRNISLLILFTCSRATCWYPSLSSCLIVTGVFLPPFTNVGSLLCLHLYTSLTNCWTSQHLLRKQALLSGTARKTHSSLLLSPPNTVDPAGLSNIRQRWENDYPKDFHLNYRLIHVRLTLFFWSLVGRPCPSAATKPGHLYPGFTTLTVTNTLKEGGKNQKKCTINQSRSSLCPSRVERNRSLHGCSPGSLR